MYLERNPGIKDFKRMFICSLINRNNQEPVIFSHSMEPTEFILITVPFAIQLIL